MKNGPPTALAVRLVSVIVSVADGAPAARAPKAMSPALIRRAAWARREIMEPPGRGKTPCKIGQALGRGNRVTTSFFGGRGAQMSRRPGRTLTRRELIGGAAGALAWSAAAPGRGAPARAGGWDTIVVGAGVFGAW